MEKLTLNTNPRVKQEEEKKEQQNNIPQIPIVFATQSRAGGQNSRNSSEGSDYDASSDNNTISKLSIHHFLLYSFRHDFESDEHS